MEGTQINGPQSPSPRRSTLSASLAVVLGLLAGGIWFVHFSQQYDHDKSGVGIVRYLYADGLKVARAELALRSVAIRRFAQQNGHLPASLADCGKEFIPVETVHVDEFLTWHATGEAASRPELDFLGLPIRYQRGESPAGVDAWVRSSDPLPTAVEDYLRSHGGIPSASPEPFALGSLFLQDRLTDQLRREQRVANGACWLWGGLVVIGIVTAVLAWVWRRGSHRLTALELVGIGLIVLITGLVGSMHVMCYAMAKFSPRSFSKTRRLEILNTAVQRGEVPAEVARTARDYIDKLPEQD